VVAEGDPVAEISTS